MRINPLALICTAMLLTVQPSRADEPTTPSSLQDRINLKYKNYFGPNSQSILPFAKMEKPDWHQLQASKTLRLIYTEPGKQYNSKVYTFTLYQLTEDGGSYYLDAKGGFWGMDELIYGPISDQELQQP